MSIKFNKKWVSFLFSHFFYRFCNIFLLLHILHLYPFYHLLFDFYFLSFHKNLYIFHLLLYFVPKSSFISANSLLFSYLHYIIWWTFHRIILQGNHITEYSQKIIFSLEFIFNLIYYILEYFILRRKKCQGNLKKS